MPSPFETDVPNREAAEQAFVAYFTTVTSRTEGELDFESLRNGIIISEALTHEDSDHFPSTDVNQDTSSEAARLQLLKRLYYNLLTCPSSALACYLPTPNLASIAETSVRADDWRIELLHLCRVVLLVQAVWSKNNEGVISVITNLEVGDQKVLKQLIEEALTSIPSLETPTDDPEVTRAEVYHQLQLDRRRAQLEKQTNREESDNVKLTTPARVRPPRRSLLRPSSPDEAGDNLADESDPSQTLPVTPLRSNRSLGSNKPVDSPMERMKNLEIDRLKLELNERSDEVTKLEIEVEEERKTVKGHLQRIETLEREVEDIQGLRDEAQEAKHISDNLKKSKLTVERLKKRLEDNYDLHDQVKQLEAQNKELEETNTLLEQKYKELSVGRSRQPNTVSNKEEPVDEEIIISQTRPTGSELERQLKNNLREREDEIEILRSKLEELEIQVQNNGTGKVLAADAIPLQSQIARSSGMDEHTETRMLEIKEENVLLKEQIRSLDSKLTQAKSVLKEQSELMSSQQTSTGSISTDPAQTLLLEKLKQQSTEAVERYHLERVIMFKGWGVVGRRAEKPLRRDLT